MGSYDVDVDTASNRLYLTFDGMLQESEAREAVAEIEEAIDRLEPGFGLVNDLSTFKPVSPDVTERIEQGKRTLAAAGLDAAVRVTGESVIGTMQMERVGGDAETYHVGTAETVADAEALLEDFRD